MGDIEGKPITVKVANRLADVDADQWDACAGTDDPFLSHAFLSALEESGCADRRTGWAPQHLLLAGDDERLIGAMPLYLKNHSQGEYVFDYGWAHAFERAGGEYYPKLQSSVPFTPVTGRRLLIRPDQPFEETAEILLAGAVELAKRYEVSSIHWTFLTEPEWSLFGRLGLLQRTAEQFHWNNAGYATFDDFLGALASRKRKAIRRERRAAVADDIDIERLTGPDIGEAHWDAFYRFYLDTGSRKWGSPYLNRRFFSLLGERMAERVLLIMARRQGRYIAGALNLIGADVVYGRYWGCIEHHDFLHFEICYYQAIEFAIARGLARVEAGAQGPHKLARGYMPVQTYSAHWIRNPAFRDAVARALELERREVEAEIDFIGKRLTPFRRDGG